MPARKRAAVALCLVLALSVTIGSPAVAAVGSYQDLDTHWGRDAIAELHELGALDDAPPLFMPNSAATRGKLSRYLTLGWGIQPYTLDRQFLSDAPPSHPYFAYINALYVRRLMVGVGGGLFGADDSLTREQAATVLVRAVGLETQALDRPAQDAAQIVSRYTDAAQISPWAVPYVAEAFIAGLFLGDAQGTFRPRASLSKAEAATVVSRVREASRLMDFGDAPDWPPYYRFPSLLSSDGARHADYRSVWLGRLADGEIDSRQVNDDAFDDGLVRFIPGTAPETYHLVFTVSAASRDPSLYGKDDDRSLFFNLLVDSDHSMKWEPSEWVVRNMRVNPNDWPAGQHTHTLTTPAFWSPVDPYTCWYRLTLTWGEPLPQGWVGMGSFAFGETEDYGPEEQKLVVRQDLLSLVHEWTTSPDANRQRVAAVLTAIVPLLDDLILEEQSEDPVGILVAKKEVILDALYDAATLAHLLGMSQADVDRIFDRLWRLMAFVTEEEAKKYSIEILRETIRLSVGLPRTLKDEIIRILNMLADLMYEQQVGHPNHILLKKKERIINALEDLLAALQKEGLHAPAARVSTALGMVRFIKALEEPIPPGEPPAPPDEPVPPDTPGGPPGVPPTWTGTPPPLPGLITGIGAVHEVSDGRVVMKVHITSMVKTPVHDVEIYYQHQGNWTGGTITPLSGPSGWEIEHGPAGVRFHGETPLVPCSPVYITLDLQDEAATPDRIVIVLTDIDGKPIGHGASQKVYRGFIELAPGQQANIGQQLGTGSPDSFFDVFLALEPLRLGANSELGGGIRLLVGGPESLLPGGYAPDGGYLPITGPLEVGQYYSLRDHTGDGHALLLVIAAIGELCVLWVEYNPGGSLLMLEP